ncbi:SpoIIAA family protein [Ramlibacter alkalitolerans]|uniref:STAS/SEC14 domain-containing protein n=1 Tax=Ramlibacter alkalitolerans TaxID=2039631 RepID=A0ABS1JK01_9BURK|nr:STAS/SEC14 domain-containing protein [Ramlibacter alkalitolerans]MBL0424511.1 STAS/SEC14 domain-containing protein [Ramlibacter alkalitolerans]
MQETVTNFDLHVAHEADHARVAVAGHPSYEQVLSMIHLLGVDSGEWAFEKLLVDLREVETVFTPEQQFRIGLEAALSLAHLRKVASLTRPERITRISEKAARRNGTNVRVFGSEQAALAWLRAAG